MDMKEQRFGIEIEMTGITRKAAADIAAAYFDTTTNFDGTYYNTYSALDSQGRKWKFMSDSSISAQKKSGRQVVGATDDYKTEMVSPICRWEDIEKVQDLIRKLREAGAIANDSCGIHVHGFRKRLIKIINMLSIRWQVCIIAVRVLHRIMKQLSSYTDDPLTKATPMRIMSLQKCSGTESEHKRIRINPVNTSNVPSPDFLLWRLKAMTISSNTVSVRCFIPEPVPSRIFPQP